MIDAKTKNELADQLNDVIDRLAEISNAIETHPEADENEIQIARQIRTRAVAELNATSVIFRGKVVTAR